MGVKRSRKQRNQEGDSSPTKARKDMNKKDDRYQSVLKFMLGDKEEATPAPGTEEEV